MEPEFLLETAEFTTLLNTIGTKISPDFTEDEVQMVFLNEGYFRMLGYEEVGRNLRSEYTVQSGRVDYITSGHGDNIRDTNTVVYEFKEPEKTLTQCTDQLFAYMEDTGAAFGVLTNGHRFQLYQQQPTTPKQLLDFKLEAAGEREASSLILAVGYWSIQEQNLRPIAEATAKKAVDEVPDELNLSFSEASIELFAEHLAHYMKDELQAETPTN